MKVSKAGKLSIHNWLTLFTDGQLRQIENNEPFVFRVKESDAEYNQAHYEALGEVKNSIPLLCNNQ